MKEPVLIVMAAGMGSRYGGLKLMDPVDDQGHAILDFSVNSWCIQKINCKKKKKILVFMMQKELALKR